MGSILTMSALITAVLGVVARDAATNPPTFLGSERTALLVIEPDLPCPWCGAATQEDDVQCPMCDQPFG